MKILLSTNTDEGGARICVEHWLRLWKGFAQIYFLSEKAHRLIGVHPDVFKHHAFSNEWAKTHALIVCDDISAVSSDAILMEVNNAPLWRNASTLSYLRKFKKRVTFNNIAWVDGTLHPEHSAFVKNYIGYAIPPGMKKMLGHLYRFTNTQEVLQYIDYDFIRTSGDFATDRSIDLVTSFRKNSHKVSEELMHRLEDLVSSCGLTYRVNSFDFRDHAQYIGWLKGNVRGYLHYQDQWVETFGYALYEGIKLCDFVIYKPEPYCDKMIDRLPEVDRSKIIRVENEVELSTALFKKDFCRFPKTTSVTKDVYMDRNYIQARMMAILNGLHEG
jgi:hypothetical protein